MIQNRIVRLFQRKTQNILNIYCTAGYPRLQDTPSMIRALASAGVDIIEIGMPYSDPIADGPTIQASNQQALENGMTLSVMFDQLKEIRPQVDIPLILMGYLNPVLQFGFERFCATAAEVGIDGLILPDMPMFEYEHTYKPLMDRYNLSNIFLISPQTAEDRIRKIDNMTEGFIYMVSMDSTTGKTHGISDKQKAYFERIRKMGLKNPTLIGFGIHDHVTYSTASQYANGVIIGSAFIKAIDNAGDIEHVVTAFISKIRGREAV